MEDLSSLKERFRRIEMAFGGTPPEKLSVDGIKGINKDGPRWEVVFDGFRPSTLGELKAAHPDAQIEEKKMGLEDIFIALVGKKESPAKHSTP